MSLLYVKLEIEKTYLETNLVVQKQFGTQISNETPCMQNKEKKTLTWTFAPCTGHVCPAFRPFIIFVQTRLQKIFFHLFVLFFWCKGSSKGYGQARSFFVCDDRMCIGLTRFYVTDRRKWFVVSLCFSSGFFCRSLWGFEAPLTSNSIETS